LFKRLEGRSFGLVEREKWDQNLGGVRALRAKWGKSGKKLGQANGRIRRPIRRETVDWRGGRIVEAVRVKRAWSGNHKNLSEAHKGSNVQ